MANKFLDSDGVDTLWRETKGLLDNYKIRVVDELPTEIDENTIYFVKEE